MGAGDVASYRALGRSGDRYDSLLAHIHEPASEAKK
jgi:hypothetical protein